MEYDIPLNKDRKLLGNMGSILDKSDELNTNIRSIEKLKSSTPDYNLKKIKIKPKKRKQKKSKSPREQDKVETDFLGNDFVQMEPT